MLCLSVEKKYDLLGPGRARSEREAIVMEETVQEKRWYSPARLQEVII
jgi:hypothetical protein